MDCIPAILGKFTSFFFFEFSYENVQGKACIAYNKKDYKGALALYKKAFKEWARSCPGKKTGKETRYDSKSFSWRSHGYGLLQHGKARSLVTKGIQHSLSSLVASAQSSHNLRSFVRGLRFQCGTSRFRLQISPPDAAVTALRSRRCASNALPRDRLNARSSGPPPRILLRRRFPEPPIAPEFQTRRLARVLYRSESSNRRREVAFRPNSNRLRVRYAYFLRRHLPLSFRSSMASSARKRPRSELPATPGRVPCPCNTCIPDACFPPELSLPHSGIRSVPFPACRVRITDACFCAIDTTTSCFQGMYPSTENTLSTYNRKRIQYLQHKTH